MNLTLLETYLAKNFPEYYFEFKDSNLIKESYIKEIILYNNKHKKLGIITYDSNNTNESIIDIVTNFISNYNDNIKENSFNPDFVIDNIKETSSYYFLHNCYPCTFIYKSNTYTNLQSAYEACKENNPINRIKYTTLDGYTAMKISPEPSDTFNSNRTSLMYKLLRIKFSDNILRQKLLSTQNKDILYYNAWHDNYWGICNCGNCSGGQNNLGLLLMKLRKELDGVQ